MATTTSTITLDESDIKTLISQLKEIRSEAREDELVAGYCALFMGVVSLVPGLGLTAGAAALLIAGGSIKCDRVENQITSDIRCLNEARAGIADGAYIEAKAEVEWKKYTVGSSNYYYPSNFEIVALRLPSGKWIYN